MKQEEENIIIPQSSESERETPKKNKKLMSLDKITTIVHIEKLKREGFVKKVSAIFKSKKA